MRAPKTDRHPPDSGRFGAHSVTGHHFPPKVARHVSPTPGPSEKSSSHTSRRVGVQCSPHHTIHPFQHCWKRLERSPHMSQTIVTTEQARALLTAPGYDAYGAVRLYGIIATGESAGQMTAIKSVTTLEGREWSEISAHRTTVADLVRRA